MKKLTLRNTFHGTKCVILAEESISPWAAYQAVMAQAYTSRGSDTQRKARRKLARINKTLCGMDGCKCGIIR